MREVVKAIIYKDNKFLLQLRDDKENIYYPNHWGFFGGEIDNHQSKENTLLREIYEELSWLPKNYQFYIKNIDVNSNCLIIYYLVYFDGDNTKLILSEGQDMKWFSLNEIKNFLTTPKNMSLFLSKINLQKI